MTETLAEKTCTPCRGGIPPLTREEAERFRDGEALALVFAQEHGAGLEAWQTRSHREDSDSVNPGSNPGPSARNPPQIAAYL
jgi:hypothetical protein